MGITYWPNNVDHLLTLKTPNVDHLLTLQHIHIYIHIYICMYVCMWGCLIFVYIYLSAISLSLALLPLLALSLYIYIYISLSSPHIYTHLQACRLRHSNDFSVRAMAFSSSSAVNLCSWRWAKTSWQASDTRPTCTNPDEQIGTLLSQTLSIYIYIYYRPGPRFLPTFYVLQMGVGSNPIQTLSQHICANPFCLRFITTIALKEIFSICSPSKKYSP